MPDDPYEVKLEGRKWVTVLHNLSSRFAPYSDMDALMKTVGFPAVPPAGQEATYGELLGWVWEELNVDEPSTFFGNLYRQARNRSLSVGDVVLVEDQPDGPAQAWAVETFGWRRVDLTDAQVPERPAHVVTDPVDNLAYVINGLDINDEPTFPEVSDA